jgi:tetratricopeptide (TPR) repeat protein
LERALEHFGFPLSEFVPLFAALLSLPNDHRYPLPAMAPQRQKQKTFEAIVLWLLKLAQHRPTWMVVEDVHWADPSTLELLNLLIDQVSHSRLFVVLIFRSEFLPPWRSQPNVTSITLGRLSSTATEFMIERVAGKRLPAEVTGEIAKKTEGVPLFVEELTRMVLESGMLREHDDHYDLTSPLVSLAIPSTLYESLMARLDRLGTAKEVAQLAATIGKEFSYDLLQAISPLDEARLTGALNRLVDAELLDQYLLPPQTNYSFRHALIRDAAYESLLRSKRRLYHSKVAKALQDRFSETVEAQPELLAHHLTEAGLIEQAVPCWQRAGHRALERSANQEAIRHLRRGLELLNVLPEILPETPERLRQELSLEISLGAALMATKGFPTDEVIGVYARARELSEQLGEATQLFRVLWGQWLNCTSRREHRAALEIGQQCLRVAQSARDPMLLAQAHQTLGAGYCTTGEFTEALGHLEQAITVDDPVRQRLHADLYGHDPVVWSLILSGWALWFLGYPDRALKRNDEGLALAQKLSHPATWARATRPLPYRTCRPTTLHWCVERGVAPRADCRTRAHPRVRSGGVGRGVELMWRRTGCRLRSRRWSHFLGSEIRRQCCRGDKCAVAYPTCRGLCRSGRGGIASRSRLLRCFGGAGGRLLRRGGSDRQLQFDPTQTMVPGP